MTVEDADYEGLQNVFNTGLERGLIDEGVFFDMNASFDPINAANVDMFHFLNTGEYKTNESLTYGPEMVVDGKSYRNYGTNGKQYADYIFDRTGTTPSKKQVRDYTMNREAYNQKYVNKPFILKERQKSYGYQGT
jgi:hypothetical protein